MNIKKILDPLPGERILGIDPELTPYPRVDRRRRPNLYPGRTLSPGALTQAQRHHDHRLAGSGQTFSPGIVTGLEVTLSHERIRTETGLLSTEIFVTLGPGKGLTRHGEDLAVLHPQRVPLGAIPVYGPVSLFLEDGEEPTETAGSLEAASDTPRRLGPTLRTLQDQGATLPPASILLLQPVVAEMIGEHDPHDPCEHDPQQDAFDDWQIVDGCRLILYLWPTEQLPLPDVSPQWRNELAYRIFTREAAQTESSLPWESIGLPLALLGLPVTDQANPGPAASHLAFREGRSLFQSFTARTPVLGSVDIRLHLAQSVEQDVMLRIQIREGTPGGTILGQAEQRLPGPLRRNTSKTVAFHFPEPIHLVPEAPYVLELLPPAEHAKALRWSVSGNTYAGGTAFHPRTGNPLVNRDFLFATMTPPFLDRHAVARQGGTRQDPSPVVPSHGTVPLYHARIQQFAEQLAEWDLARLPIEHVRRQFRFLPPFGLLPRVSPSTLPYQDASRFFPEFHVDAAPVPQEQLGKVMDDTMGLSPFDRTEDPDRVLLLVPVPQSVYEPNLLVTERIDPRFAQAVQELVERRGKWLNRRADVRQKAQAVTEAITGKAPTYPANNDDPDNLEPNEFVAQDPLDPDDPSLREPEAAFGTTLVTTTGPDGTTTSRLTVDLVEEFKANVFPERSPLASERTRFISIGLTAFIQHLETVIAKLDDQIDFGFTRVQTDLYRIRQLILGTAEATRLATSPILASIAKGESARATKEDIKRFLNELKQSVSVTTPPTGGAPREAGEGPSRATTPVGPGAPGFSAIPSGTFFTATQPSPVAMEPTVSTAKGDLQAAIGQATLQKTIESQARAESTAKFLIDTGKKHDVIEQLPIYGKAYDLRNVTIAKRFEEPKASESKGFSLSSKYETLAGLAALAADNEAVLDDIPVHGVQKEDVEADSRTGLYERESLSFGTLRPNLARRILNEKDPAKVDEATFFQDAVTVLDSTVATFRAVEARILEYRRLLDASRALLRQLQALETSIQRRLEEIGEQLAEARHDVAVARALFAEEDQRIQAINARRRKILTEHVTAVAFVRPRTQDGLVDPATLPLRPLHPALSEEPVPACLARNVEPPPELEHMTAVLRDAPVKWFPAIPPLLKRLDRWESLHTTLRTGIVRAQLGPRTTSLAPTEPAPATKQATKPLFQALAVQTHAVAHYRAALARFNPALLAGLTWKGLYGHVVETVSIGDVIDAPHGRSDIVAKAGKELENIEHVAVCVYEAFALVPAPIRLQWVQILSQFDRPINLRNLANLPRWSELEFSLSRQLQTLVDWLYSRIDARIPDAVALMTDLVRVCVLLASHAPVKDIIAGRVSEPVPVVPGNIVKIRTLDVQRVRAGMTVQLFAATAVVGYAVVEDLAGEAVTARIVSSTQPQLTLEQEARVQFTERARVEHPRQEAAPRRTDRAHLLF